MYSPKLSTWEYLGMGPVTYEISIHQPAGYPHPQMKIVVLCYPQYEGHMIGNTGGSTSYDFGSTVFGSSEWFHPMILLFQAIRMMRTGVLVSFNHLP